MDDLISKKAAIDALYSVDEYNSRSIEAIRRLPPIQPESAQWVQMLINPRMYRCSNCSSAWNKRLVFDLDHGNEMVMRYCPRCGKKMLAEVDYE